MVLYLYLASLLAIEGPIDRDAIFRLIQPAFVYRRLVNGEPIPQCPPSAVPKRAVSAFWVWELRLSIARWMVCAVG